MMAAWDRSEGRRLGKQLLTQIQRISAPGPFIAREEKGDVLMKQDWLDWDY